MFILRPCLSSCMSAPRDEERRIDGQRTGTARPFPLWRLPSGRIAAHRSNIREWYCPQARIAGHSTSQLIVRFQPAPRLSVGETALGYECGAFATYRPVSCASTSTICRCITACARRYSQLAALPLDPSELSSRCRCCFHGHSHHNATGSLNP
jgi:hypothetical protein